MNTEQQRYDLFASAILTGLLSSPLTIVGDNNLHLIRSIVDQMAKIMISLTPKQISDTITTDNISTGTKDKSKNEYDEASIKPETSLKPGTHDIGDSLHSVLSKQVANVIATKTYNSKLYTVKAFIMPANARPDSYDWPEWFHPYRYNFFLGNYVYRHENGTVAACCPDEFLARFEEAK